MTLSTLKEALDKKGYEYHEQKEDARTTAGQVVGRYSMVYAVRGDLRKCLGVKDLVLEGPLRSLQENDVWKEL